MQTSTKAKVLYEGPKPQTRIATGAIRGGPELDGAWR
jgi:hypothetical protein